MEEFEREGMIDTIRCRRDGEPIQYIAPGAERRWRARDLVDIHWKLTGIETPSESYNRIMSCIIGHANPNTGRCQLKRKLIAAETGYSIETVKRVIKWWVSKKFLVVESAGIGRSNAYHPQWELFELHYIAIAEDINAQKEAWRHEAALQRHGGVIKGTHTWVIKGTHEGVITVTHMNLKVEPQRRNLIQNGRTHLRRVTPHLLKAKKEKKKRATKGSPSWRPLPLLRLRGRRRRNALKLTCSAYRAPNMTRCLNGCHTPARCMTRRLPPSSMRRTRGCCSCWMLTARRRRHEERRKTP
jgi:hypothetical protein